MAQSTRALFVVSDVLKRENNDGQTMSILVRLNPSYEKDGPNRTFWEATPTGHLEMTINNPEVFAFFRTGKKFFLDFTPADG